MTADGRDTVLAGDEVLLSPTQDRASADPTDTSRASEDAHDINQTFVLNSARLQSRQESMDIRPKAAYLAAVSSSPRTRSMKRKLEPLVAGSPRNNGSTAVNALELVRVRTKHLYHEDDDSRQHFSQPNTAMLFRPDTHNIPHARTEDIQTSEEEEEIQISISSEEGESAAEEADIEAALLSYSKAQRLDEETTNDLHTIAILPQNLGLQGPTTRLGLSPDAPGELSIVRYQRNLEISQDRQSANLPWTRVGEGASFAELDDQLSSSRKPNAERPISNVEVHISNSPAHLHGLAKQYLPLAFDKENRLIPKTSEVFRPMQQSVILAFLSVELADFHHLSSVFSKDKPMPCE